MKSPKEYHRTTLACAFDGRTLLPHSGIYVLAYMGQILYVGKAEDVVDRFRLHCLHGRPLRVDGWLREMAWDYDNVRLDILETPDDVIESHWLANTEAACIRRFSPLFNTQLSGVRFV